MTGTVQRKESDKLRLKDKWTRYFGRWKYCSWTLELQLLSLSGRVSISLRGKKIQAVREEAEKLCENAEDRINLRKVLDYLS